jgi:hypothetical protein
MSVLYQRFCVKSESGNYFGEITTNREMAESLLTMAKEKHENDVWHIISWYD